MAPPTMDSFDGLLPALFSLLSNYIYRAQGCQPPPAPYNLTARSPWLDHLATASSSSSSSSDGADWKLLRQPSSSNNSRLAGMDSWCPASAAARGGGLYAKLLTSNTDHEVLLPASASLNCALMNTKLHRHPHPHHVHLHAASDGDFYHALADHP